MVDEMEVRMLRERVSELEAQVKFLYKHLDVTYIPAPFSVDEADLGVVDCLKKGDVMKAIQTYRLVHKVSLDEAKKAVEYMKANLGY